MAPFAYSTSGACSSIGTPAADDYDHAVGLNLSTYMLIGIVGIVVIKQFNRLVGSIIAIGFWIVVAIIGWLGYQHTKFALIDIELSLPQFLGLCAALGAVQGFDVYSVLRRRRNQRAYQEALDDAENDRTGQDDQR